MSGPSKTNNNAPAASVSAGAVVRPLSKKTVLEGDLLQIILSFLPKKEIIRVSRTNKAFQIAASSDCVWRTIATSCGLRLLASPKTSSNDTEKNHKIAEQDRKSITSVKDAVLQQFSETYGGIFVGLTNPLTSGRKIEITPIMHPFHVAQVVEKWIGDYTVSANWNSCFNLRSPELQSPGLRIRRVAIELFANRELRLHYSEPRWQQQSDLADTMLLAIFKSIKNWAPLIAESDGIIARAFGLIDEQNQGMLTICEALAPRVANAPDNFIELILIRGHESATRRKEFLLLLRAASSPPSAAEFPLRAAVAHAFLDNTRPTNLDLILEGCHSCQYLEALEKDVNDLIKEPALTVIAQIRRGYALQNIALLGIEEAMQKGHFGVELTKPLESNDRCHPKALRHHVIHSLKSLITDMDVKELRCFFFKRWYHHHMTAMALGKADSAKIVRVVQKSRIPLVSAAAPTLQGRNGDPQIATSRD